MTSRIIVLTNGKVMLLDPATLEEKSVLVKSGATTFAINSNDSIAIAVSKKVLFYYFDLQKVTIAPLILGKSNEAVLHDQVSKVGILPYKHPSSLE